MIYIYIHIFIYNMQQLNDSLILIYGLENIVDFFSSAIVLWRFNDHHPPTNDTTTTNTNNHQNNANIQMQTTALQNREKRASIGVSIVLAILGFGGLITAIDDLASGIGEISEGNGDFWFIYNLSFFSFIIFGALAKFKFHYAKLLRSPSLRKDGLCSLIGCILGAAMFFNALLAMMSSDEAWWWLDPTVALFCALGALGYGLYGMYKAYVKDGYPICSCQWWLYGGGKIEEQRRQERVIGGGLELQATTNDDSAMAMAMAAGGNPSMSSSGPSGGVSMVQSRSGDEEMSDIVIT